MPRKTLKQRRAASRPTDTDPNINRIRGVVDSLGEGTKINPTDVMKSLMEALQPLQGLPEPDKYYTYIYNAKTPGLRYDQHPLVRISSLSRDGFTGINLHWNDSRRYTYPEIVSSLYEIYQSEVSDAMELPTAYYQTNS